MGAFEALGIGAVAGAVVAMAFQGSSLQSVFSVAYNGFTSDTEIAVLKAILNRGGMSSMLQYVAIITFAVGMGGMLDRLGVLNRILSPVYQEDSQRWLPDSGHHAGGLCDQHRQLLQPHVPRAHGTADAAPVQGETHRAQDPVQMSGGQRHPGRPHDPLARIRDLHGRNSGVAWSQYILFVPLLWLTPVFSIFYGYTGISILHTKDQK